MGCFRRFSLLFLLVFAAAWGLDSAPASAWISPQERLAIKRIKDQVSAAGANYKKQDYQQAGENLTSAIKLVDKLMQTAGPEVYDELSPTFKYIVRGHALLELEGVRLPRFKAPARPTAKPKGAEDEPAMEAEEEATPEPAEAAAPDGEDGVSFAQDVAPILVQHCGRCHVRGARGNFSMATFAALRKGPPEGVVYFAGDVVGSRLIETIETGDMPRGGGKVPAAQLKTLKDWILQGAKFDGPSPDAPLASYADGATAPEPSTPELKTQRATGDETVSFAADVAPLLVANCNGCHIDAMQVRGGLRMDTFAQLLRGGDSGAIITPGQGDASLLVQKLRGQAGDIMPAGGRPALPDESIQLISSWIDEGAKLDGISEDQPLRRMAALAWAREATHEELQERRVDLARENWQLGSTPAARDATEELEGEQFYLVGNVSAETLETVHAAANEALAKVETLVKAPTGQPLIKGRVTLFVFPKRYEYAEFSKMVEQRSVPVSWTEHWRYDIIDAYVPLVMNPRGDDASTIEARLIEPLTAIAVSAAGVDVPRWFAVGVGRGQVAKLAARDHDRVQVWKDQLPAALATMKKKDDFLKGRMQPEEADLVAFGVGKQMLDRNRRQLTTLIDRLRDGATFESAFTQVFGGTPQQYVDAALPYAIGGRRR